jgi:hypothetical protein
VLTVEERKIRHRLAQQRYCLKNKEARELSTQKWRDNNRQKIKAQNQYDTVKDSKKNYRKNNKGLINTLTANRRARKKQAQPNWVSIEQIKEFYMKCPEGMTVDHIIPLDNKFVCGLHVLCNLQYLSPLENSVKKNKFDFTYENKGSLNAI